MVAILGTKIDFHLVFQTKTLAFFFYHNTDYTKNVSTHPYNKFYPYHKSLLYCLVSDYQSKMNLHGFYYRFWHQTLEWNKNRYF